MVKIIRIDIFTTFKQHCILRNSMFVSSFQIRIFLNSTFWPLKYRISFPLFPKCVRVFPGFRFVDFTGLSIRVFHPLPIFIVGKNYLKSNKKMYFFLMLHNFFYCLNVLNCFLFLNKIYSLYNSKLANLLLCPNLQSHKLPVRLFPLNLDRKN